MFKIIYFRELRADIFCAIPVLSAAQNYFEIFLKSKRFHSSAIGVQSNRIKPTQLIPIFLLHKYFPPFEALLWTMSKIILGYFDNTMLDKFVQGRDIVDDLVFDRGEELVNFPDGNIALVKVLLELLGFLCILQLNFGFVKHNVEFLKCKLFLFGEG